MPTITWKKLGVSIYVGQMLTVAKAKLKDNGTYTCHANNGIGGQSTASADVVVNGKFLEGQNRQVFALLCNCSLVQLTSVFFFLFQRT